MCILIDEIKSEKRESNEKEQEEMQQKFLDTSESEAQIVGVEPKKLKLDMDMREEEDEPSIKGKKMMLVAGLYAASRKKMEVFPIQNLKKKYCCFLTLDKINDITDYNIVKTEEVKKTKEGTRRTLG